MTQDDAQLAVGGILARSSSSSPRIDEGYSDETKSDFEAKSSSTGNAAVAFPDWFLAQTESDRAGE